MAALEAEGVESRSWVVLSGGRNIVPYIESSRLVLQVLKATYSDKSPSRA